MAGQLRPWMIGGLVVVVLSGGLIFVATPEKYLASNPFRVKMAVLGVAMLFQYYGVLRRFAGPDAVPRSRAARVVAAALSLTLWFTVGWAGRAAPRRGARASGQEACPSPGRLGRGGRGTPATARG